MDPTGPSQGQRPPGEDGQRHRRRRGRGGQAVAADGLTMRVQDVAMARPPRPAKGPGQNKGGKKVRKVRPARHQPHHHEMDPAMGARREALMARKQETWWGDRWMSALNRLGWKGRLANGRLYADEGRVIQMVVEGTKVKARVQGTRTMPYEVTIGLKVIADSDWELVVDVMSCQAVFTAQLLAGEMPLDVEEAFDAAYAPLYPRAKDDVQAHCSCPDWANPCKHTAAVYCMMAEALDKDPYLLFALRGKGRDELIAMLRTARAAEARAMPLHLEMLDAGSLDGARFWQAGEELDGVAVHIVPPTGPGTGKRLGRPPFWRSPADPITQLNEVYEAISRRAREVALGG